MGTWAQVDLSKILNIRAFSLEKLLEKDSEFLKQDESESESEHTCDESDCSHHDDGDHTHHMEHTDHTHGEHGHKLAEDEKAKEHKHHHKHESHEKHSHHDNDKPEAGEMATHGKYKQPNKKHKHKHKQ